MVSILAFPTLVFVKHDHSICRLIATQFESATADQQLAESTRLILIDPGSNALTKYSMLIDILEDSVVTGWLLAVASQHMLPLL